ncbi:hypothetical protein B0J15DRAFT_473153 [Fusarium solani]|uniref:Uncharacterized protein n=1 Tax=Fusarium solani TaxID=169388 RepID=A0A9P9G2K5_FUSSL|nr:uncharacterized protein B0J15DRAFT_473153 [Fusarium solani]KAH7230274.1 hypothetical protein B0J15DRAFT_473153 [Fusarium solani]
MRSQRARSFSECLREMHDSITSVHLPSHARQASNYSRRPLTAQRGVTESSTSDTLELAVELAECYETHKQPASTIVRPLQSALEGIGSPSLSEVGPIPAAESLFRALDDIKNRTLPFPGHIYDTAQQLSTLVENHKDALAVIESVVRPNNKDQNLFHFLCATNLTTLLDVNGRIKEAIEFKSAKCKMSKILLQLQMSPPVLQLHGRVKTCRKCENNEDH